MFELRFRRRRPGTTYVTGKLHIEDDTDVQLKGILLIDSKGRDDIAEEGSTQQQMADVDVVGKAKKRSQHGVPLAE